MNLFDEKKFNDYLDAYYDASSVPITDQEDIDVIQDKFEAFLNQSIVDAVEKFAAETKEHLKGNYAHNDGVLIEQIFKDELSTLKSRAGKLKEDEK